MRSLSDEPGLTFSRLSSRRSLLFVFCSSAAMPRDRGERGDLALGAGGGAGCMASSDTAASALQSSRPNLSHALACR